jgi:hypothetical protein
MMNSCEGISESAVRAPEGEGHKCRRARIEGPCWSEAQAFPELKVFEFGHTLVILEAFDPPRVELTIF